MPLFVDGARMVFFFAKEWWGLHSYANAGGSVIHHEASSGMGKKWKKQISESLASP